MRHLILLSIGSLFFAISSCCFCENMDDETGHHQDTVNHDTTLALQHDLDTNFVDTGGYVNDSLAIQNEIEEKYGVQWDFCDCVVKNDSIQKAFDKVLNTEPLDEPHLDLIMARMDEVDLHCKTMLTQPNKTPEQRDRHERKVRKCLKEAGVL